MQKPYKMPDKQTESLLSDKTFLALIFNADGQGFITSYGIEGCQNLRRNALYSWMKQAIDENKTADIDFLEIMISVVQQLNIEYPNLKILP